MANEIRLEAYTFRIREFNKRKDCKNYQPLDSFFPGKDFFQFIISFFDSFKGTHKDNENQKELLSLENKSIKVQKESRLISGIFKSGNYGYGAEIVHRRTGAKKPMGVDEAPMLPFYFLFAVPVKRNVGLVLLSRFGNHGVTSVFRQEFIQFFRKQYSGFMIDFGGFISADLADEYKNGQIRKFSLKRYNLPPDIAERLGLHEYTETISSIELIVRAKQGRYFQKLQEKINRGMNGKNTRFMEVPELDMIGFDAYRQVQVEAKFGHDKKTFEFGTSPGFLPYYNINDEVKKDAENHPIFEDIDRIAKKYLDEFINELI